MLRLSEDKSTAVSRHNRMVDWIAPDESNCVWPRWQRQLLGLLALSFGGTGAELLLLDHTEGFWQKVPLGITALSLVALGGHAFFGCTSTARLLQGSMWLAIVSGIAGLAFHFRGNLEFELEMHPDESGLPLVWKTLKGATPALAPGMMILLGLLGLLATGRRASSASSLDPNPNCKQLK